MTEQAQRIAIAKACGWKVIIFRGVFAPTEKDWVGHHESLCPPGRTGKWQGPLPDYLRDLNAIHDAESFLFGRGGRECAEYMSVLSQICFAGTNHANWFLAHATAPQRAEAFLRATGRWVDEK